MHFDIVEAMRQKQQQQARSVSVDNGDVIDITTSDGKIVVNPRPVSERLIFEPLEARHASELFESLRDPELYQFLDESPPVSERSLRERFAALESRKSPDGKQLWLNWAVREKETGCAIGCVQATLEDERAHIGYILAKHAWGKGLGAEAVSWLVRRMLALHVTRIIATVEERNVPSLRILESLGFMQLEKIATEITLERGAASG